MFEFQRTYLFRPKNPQRIPIEPRILIWSIPHNIGMHHRGFEYFTTAELAKFHVVDPRRKRIYKRLGCKYFSYRQL